MKKTWLFIGIILVVIALLGMFSPEKLRPENPAGKAVYYTMITSSGVQNKNERYGYELTAYNEQGKEKKLGFSAGKRLKQGAYVRLYHTLIRGVTHWEEVSFEELPKEVQLKYLK